jgi:hypothetical protein
MRHATLLAATAALLAPSAAHAATTIDPLPNGGQLHVGGQLQVSGSTDVPGATLTWTLDGQVVAGNVTNPTLTVPQSGQLVLSASDGVNPAESSAPRQVTAFSVPQISAFVPQVCPGQQGQAQAQTSSPAFGTNGVAAWDLDTSDPFPGGEAAGVLTKQLAGRRQAPGRVKVTWPDGTTSGPTTFQLGVPAPPAAQFQPPFTRPLRRQAITLQASGSFSSCPLTYTWSFGDGTTGTGQSVQKAFPNADDTFGVSVSVDDGGGAVASAPVGVRTAVNQTPSGALTAPGTFLVRGETATLLASKLADLDGDVTALDWDLDGDGAFDDATGPEATFTNPGTTAGFPRLRITDDLGGTTTLQAGMLVAGPPQLGVSATRGVVTGTYLGARGGALNDSGRDTLRQTADPSAVRFGLTVAFGGLRRATGRLVVAGKLARRLGLSPSGADLVLATGELEGPGGGPVTTTGGTTTYNPFVTTPPGGFGQQVPPLSAFSGPSSAQLVLTSTAEARKLFARIKRLPVLLELAAVDGAAQPVGSSTAVVLEESKGGGRGRGRAAMRLRFGARAAKAVVRPRAVRARR